MSTDQSTDQDIPDACRTCAPLHARREFLRTIAGAALLSLGVAPARAQAFALSLDHDTTRNGDVATFPVPEADGVTIDTNNEVILVRSHDHVYAFALACPHQNTALKWHADDGRFQCPKHKSLYQPDGTFIEGRATRGLDRHALKRDGANIVVDLDKVFEQDKDAAGWAAAQVTL
jgi:nitrite reductase/ring-hydroxylating ferredoxin subunit